MSTPQNPPPDRSPSLASKYIAILFDIDRTLIISGGAGAASWRMTFDELYGIPDRPNQEPQWKNRTDRQLLHAPRAKTRSNRAHPAGNTSPVDRGSRTDSHFDILPVVNGQDSNCYATLGGRPC
jgi:phosphoglycolate phosphatase-like HAD superfamily hydrolase